MSSKKTEEMRGLGSFPISASTRELYQRAIKARMREVGDKYIMRLRLPKRRKDVDG